MAIGSLTVHRIRADFNRQVLSTANQLRSQLTITVDPFRIEPPLADFASTANHSVIRILSLPGTVVALLAEEGAKLEKGAPILTLEVMKMEQTLRAPYAGVLKKIKCKVGDIVGEGVELAEVEPAAS